MLCLEAETLCDRKPFCFVSSREDEAKGLLVCLRRKSVHAILGSVYPYYISL